MLNIKSTVKSDRLFGEDDAEASVRVCDNSNVDMKHGENKKTSCGTKRVTRGG